jgi:hypothetical protein
VEALSETARLVNRPISAYSHRVSAFLIQQDQQYAVLLADSLGTKESPGVGRIPVAAPKLVHVAPCAYAAHAGTWQPALEMLSRLRSLIISREGVAPANAASLSVDMPKIGVEVHAEFQKLFRVESLDVRVALLLTGNLRHPDDAAEGRSSTVLLWEAASQFVPKRITGGLYFGGSPVLSDLAGTILNHPFVLDTMRQSPLACAQGLLAAHSALSRLSTSISPEANVVVCGEGEEHAVLHGTLVTLPNRALAKG